MRVWLIRNVSTDEYRGYRLGVKYLSWGSRLVAKQYTSLKNAKLALKHCWNNRDVIVLQEVEIEDVFITQYLIEKTYGEKYKMEFNCFKTWEKICWEEMSDERD